MARVGRPKTSPLTRREQLRLAKQRQRKRDRALGVAHVALPMGRDRATKLRAAMTSPTFEAGLDGFLDERVVDMEACPVLRGLAWNRAGRYVPAEQALAIYERNWRFVDLAAMQPDERALLDRLKARHGRGLLNG
jgi:hypothetical protein